MDRRRARLTVFSAAMMPLLALLAGCRDESRAGDSTASPTSGATPSAAENDVASAPPRIDMLGDGTLEAGSYALPLLGPVHHPVAVVNVPPDTRTGGRSSTRPSRRRQKIR